MSCIKIKQGGNWVAAQPYIKVANVWEQATSVWVKADGVWEEISCNGTIVAPATLNQTDINFNSPASAGWRFNTDGTLSKRTSALGWTSAGSNWLSGGSSSDYDILWTTTSGSITGGGPIGSWQSLTTSKEIYVNAVSAPSDGGWIGSVKIRQASTLNVVYTGSHNIYAENQT
tara:strand:+ start:4785 stop:5303 length:519 start_codon:yes stop_codon:yes gene_type:complete